jgi:hypothetical protein
MNGFKAIVIHIEGVGTLHITQGDETIAIEGVGNKGYINFETWIAYNEIKDEEDG